MKLKSTCEKAKTGKPDAISDPKLKRAWKEFTARYPTQDKCLTEIVRILIDSGTIFCRECKNRNWEDPIERLLKCSTCRAPRSATAGTFFDHMRSYQAWLAALWFAERKIPVSSLTFQRLLNIAYSSARSILKRVMKALQEPMASDQNNIKVPSAAFIEIFRRRSYETEARQSPKSEEPALNQSNEELSQEPKLKRAINKRNASRQRQSDVAETIANLPEDQKTLLDLLSAAPLRSDQLAQLSAMPISQVSGCLSILQMDGLCNRLPGNLFSATQSADGDAELSGASLTERESAAVEAAEQFISEKYSGISRKDLHIYLTAYWCCMRKRKRNERTVLDACLKMGKKTCRELFEEVTPGTVRVWIAARAA